MIGPTGAVRVMVATKPVNFRKGAEGLAALLRDFFSTIDPQPTLQNVVRLSKRSAKRSVARTR